MNKQNLNKPQVQLCNIHDVRHSCTCGKEWSVNTNKFIGEHEPLICEKCDGYITVDQNQSY